MKKILFLIHDLGHGGAEKVLVNLVNNMDREKFDISVTALFGGGVNEQFLKPHIHYRAVFPKAFPGNSHIMKLLTPKRLHWLCVKERYDIEVAYLEGPAARVVSGCGDEGTKLVSWIHTEFATEVRAAQSFRSHDEALACCNSFDSVVCVSKTVQENFLRVMPVAVPTQVLYNTNESDKILALSRKSVEDGLLSDRETNLIAVGKLVENKGFHRLIPIVKRLREDGLPVHLYILGMGPMEGKLHEQAKKLEIEDLVTFLGYRTNPYKYMAKSDLFVCSSFAEGFSTAATEALIVGTPVCTVEVSGMKEMLGENNEWGVVTKNDDEALYLGLRWLLSDQVRYSHYKEQARLRGKMFSTENTVKAVERMLEEL